MVRQVPGLADAGEIVYAHMERCDGSGYPRRLKDAAVPLGARIVAIADAFDMFISDRPHRRELAVRQARDEISRWSSFSFDPAVVEVSLRMPVSFDTGCSVG
jgi:HD-GYP domain-containing protein (c-di-GMP phosphodiesterase class II)